jgi:hypothetical protein
MKSYTYRAQEPEPEKSRGPAIFSARRLARQQTGVERFAAILLLIVSLIGSVLAGGGGVERWLVLRPVLWSATAAGVLQLVLSYVQYTYCIRWTSWQYLGAVLLSTTLTLIGYWPLAHPWMVDVLEWVRVPSVTAPYWASALLIIAAVGIDLFPERTLVGRE